MTMTDENSTGDKNFTTALLLCIFLGTAGAHRFYVGKPGTAVVQFFTAGGLLIWWLVDLIAICNGTFVDKEGKLLKK